MAPEQPTYKSSIELRKKVSGKVCKPFKEREIKTKRKRKIVEKSYNYKTDVFYNNIFLGFITCHTTCTSLR
jgi:homoserine kinase